VQSDTFLFPTPSLSEAAVEVWLDKIGSHVYYSCMNKIFDINHSLPAQCILLGKRVAEMIDARLGTVGLSNAKMSALHSIVTSDGTAGPVTVTCLADAMNTTKSNVTAMIDRLIAEGLVTRTHSIEDRRAVVIALTEAGQQRYMEGVEVVRVLHAELSGMFSAEEMQLLNHLMDKLPS